MMATTPSADCRFGIMDGAPISPAGLYSAIHVLLRMHAPLRTQAPPRTQAPRRTNAAFARYPREAQ
jgi:hypothetical protein